MGGGDAVDEKDRNTALHMATRAGKLDNVMCLVHHDANLHAATKGGDTATSLTADKCQVTYLWFLIHSGSHLGGGEIWNQH